MPFIEALLEELPVRADLGPSCSATKISAPGPSLLGGSATVWLKFLSKVGQFMACRFLKDMLGSWLIESSQDGKTSTSRSQEAMENRN